MTFEVGGGGCDQLPPGVYGLSDSVSFGVACICAVPDNGA